MAYLENINKLNIWFFFIITCVILFSVNHTCFRLGRRWKAKFKLTPSDIISTNMLGLLALILGFSFSMAINRFELRREFTAKEANAIGTAFLRSGLINFERPAQVKELFKKYVDLRIEAFNSKVPLEVLEKIKPVRDDIWDKVKVVTVKDRGEIESLYIDSLNEMFDTANSRTLVSIKMLPVSFYLLILILASVCVGLMSFDRGYKDDASYVRSILFIVMFGLLFTFIYDLDHFRKGLTRITQDPIIQVRESM